MRTGFVWTTRSRHSGTVSMDFEQNTISYGVIFIALEKRLVTSLKRFSGNP